MSSAEYEIIIVGGGPAGLSAASSVVRQDHKTVLFDSGAYRNSKSRHMHTLPSWDHANPQEFRAKARADLDRYGTVTVVKDTVVSLRQKEDGLFEAVGGDGKSYVAKKVILATGVEDIYPDIEGYEECWVTGMYVLLFSLLSYTVVPRFFLTPLRPYLSLIVCSSQHHLLYIYEISHSLTS